MLNREIKQRVVITGMGALTPLGLSVTDTWAGLVAGRSGVAQITQFDASELPFQIAGEVKGFDPAQYIGSKEARRMARCSQLALAAGLQAMTDAGFESQAPDPDRAGIVFGTANGGFDAGTEAWDTLNARGWRRLNPFIFPASLCNMPAHHLSLRFQCRAYSSTVVTACASGTQAIGEAVEVIRRGAADFMLAGGVEGLIHPAFIAAMAAMRTLSSDQEHPEQAMKPFDARRDGFVCSEGSAVIVLERLDRALDRGARMYAEVLGYAATTDAYHIAIPDPDGAGAVRCMRWALENAGISPSEVHYINAHGPATEVGDAVETKAIKTVFQQDAYRVPVSSTKSMIGHASGGAGAIEAMACVKTIQTGTIHPTINYEIPDPECDLDYVPNQARQVDVRTALSNSFGLGGQNACLVLRRFEE